MVSIYFQCVVFEVRAGTKNVAKELHKICAGPVHARDGTWFIDLSNKDIFFTINGISRYSARSTKVHLYWYMRNRVCGQP